MFCLLIVSLSASMPCMSAHLTLVRLFSWSINCLIVCLSVCLTSVHHYFPVGAIVLEAVAEESDGQNAFATVRRRKTAASTASATGNATSLAKPSTVS